MHSKLLALLRDESGSSSIEYLVVAMGLALALGTIVVNVEAVMRGVFTFPQQPRSELPELFI